MCFIIANYEACSENLRKAFATTAHIEQQLAPNVHFDSLSCALKIRLCTMADRTSSFSTL
jgi:hypothetical protein